MELLKWRESCLRVGAEPSRDTFHGTERASALPVMGSRT